jgi:hypothetical protein
MKRKYEAVLITWDDAEVSNDWEIQVEGTPLEEALVETLGFLVKETEKYYVVASTLSADHTNARTKIPKGMVKSLKKVRA